MSIIESIEQFENYAISVLLCLLVKFYGFDSAVMECEPRPQVASRFWITITLKKDGREMIITAQETRIAKKRLIEYLDKIGLRQH